jgi:hypothetical protein
MLLIFGGSHYFGGDQLLSALSVREEHCTCAAFDNLRSAFAREQINICQLKTAAAQRATVAAAKLQRDAVCTV